MIQDERESVSGKAGTGVRLTTIVSGQERYRVVTRYMGSGITTRGIECFCGIRDQNSQRLLDQGSKFRTKMWSK